MKKITFVILTALFIVSCGGKQKQTTANEEELVVQSSEVLEFSGNDEHNARNSLDYVGTYKGILPVNEKSMKLTIILSDSTYTLQGEIEGEKIKLANDGKYTWDEVGSTISLEGVESPNQYWVVEGALVPLLEGNTEAIRLEKVNE